MNIWQLIWLGQASWSRSSSVITYSSIKRKHFTHHFDNTMLEDTRLLQPDNQTQTTRANANKFYPKQKRKTIKLCEWKYEPRPSRHIVKNKQLIGIQTVVLHFMTDDPSVAVSQYNETMWEHDRKESTYIYRGLGSVPWRSFAEGLGAHKCLREHMYWHEARVHQQTNMRLNTNE